MGMNTDEKFVQLAIVIFPIHFILLENWMVSRKILELEYDLRKVFQEKNKNENDEISEVEIVKLMDISQNLESCYVKLFNVNRLYSEIDMVESITERQFQTIVLTTLLIFSKNFKRITTIFESSLGISLEIFLILNWCLNIFGFIRSLINYNQHRKFPVEPGINGKLLQFLGFGVLTLFKIVLITISVSNAPYIHLIGYIMQVVIVWQCNSLLYHKESGLRTLFSVSMISAFFKPPDSESEKRLKLFGQYDPHGGIVNTIFLELISFILYCIIGLVLRNGMILNLISRVNNDEYGNDVIHAAFNILIVEFNLPIVLLLLILLLVIYPAITLAYHRFGHPYKMKYDSTQNDTLNCSMENNQTENLNLESYQAILSTDSLSKQTSSHPIDKTFIDENMACRNEIPIEIISSTNLLRTPSAPELVILSHGNKTLGNFRNIARRYSI